MTTPEPVTLPADVQQQIADTASVLVVACRNLENASPLPNLAISEKMQTVLKNYLTSLVLDVLTDERERCRRACVSCMVGTFGEIRTAQRIENKIVEGWTPQDGKE